MGNLINVILITVVTALLAAGSTAAPAPSPAAGPSPAAVDAPAAAPAPRQPLRLADAPPDIQALCGDPPPWPTVLQAGTCWGYWVLIEDWPVGCYQGWDAERNHFNTIEDYYACLNLLDWTPPATVLPPGYP